MFFWIAIFLNFLPYFLKNAKKNKIRQNNNLVNIFHGEYKTDFCEYHEQASESKKASKKQF